MGRRFGSLALSIAAALAIASPLFADSYKVDPVHSGASFRIGHLGVGRVQGRFDEVNGSFTLEADATKNTFDISMPTAKLDTNNSARDTHVRGPDFFNSAEFKEITFKSTQVAKVDDTHFNVTGDLTVHGVTKSITLAVEKIGQADLPPPLGSRAGLEAVFTIKRSDFGMAFMADKIGDDVMLIVDLEGTKQ
jgi:polyisoprenoid-binding protein YceI